MSENLKTDLAKLLLRLSVGGLMLFHGVSKLLNGHHHIASMLESNGLPTILQYGVPVGEVIAPLLLIVGILTVPSALLIVTTMLFSIFLAFAGKIFSLNAYGGWIIELNVLFLFSAVAIALLGPGRLRLGRKNHNSKREN